jgi:hypothetical protein
MIKFHLSNCLPVVIIGLLQLTYHTITTPQLCESLNLEETQLDGLISKHGWKHGGTSVSFLPAEELQVKSKKPTEAFTLDRIICICLLFV